MKRILFFALVLLPMVTAAQSVKWEAGNKVARKSGGVYSFTFRNTEYTQLVVFESVEIGTDSTYNKFIETLEYLLAQPVAKAEEVSAKSGGVLMVASLFMGRTVVRLYNDTGTAFVYMGKKDVAKLRELWQQ